jgi:large subunit ribosomal protein L24
MQAKTRLRKGDMVQIMSGRSKGKQGKIMRIQESKSRVFIEGTNTVKCHMKPSQKHPQGGVVDKEAPVHWSNVQLLPSDGGKPVRVEKARRKSS